MSPYRAKDGRTWKVRVTDHEGRRRVRSTGTRSLARARKMERLVRRLARRKRDRWASAILAALVDRTITLEHVAHLAEARRLVAYGKQLAAVDLRVKLDEWEKTGANPIYVRQCRALITSDVRFPAPLFTRARISKFLAELPHSGSTKNRYRSAFSQFAWWLVETEVIRFNPVRRVRGASENKARDRWEPPVVCETIARAGATVQERALFALMQGGCVERSAAMRMMARDFEPDFLETGIAQVRGTKRTWRARMVVVDPWARPIVWEAVKGRVGATPIFDEFNYYGIDPRWMRAVRAVGVTDYRVHDARHSWVVNALKRGERPEVVARQAGHKDTKLIWEVYGQYVPTTSDYREAGATSLATSGPKALKRKVK